MSTAAAALLVSGIAATVGLYGAINAHRALQWQRRRDAERNSKHVRAHFEHSITIDADVKAFVHSLVLIIVNESELATIYISDIHATSPSNAGGLNLNYGRDDADEDVRLEPYQRVRRQFRLDRLTFDPAKGVVGVVRLATGEEVRTEVEYASAMGALQFGIDHFRKQMGLPPESAAEA